MMKPSSICPPSHALIFTADQLADLRHPLALRARKQPDEHIEDTACESTSR